MSIKTDQGSLVQPGFDGQELGMRSKNGYDLTPGPALNQATVKFEVVPVHKNNFEVYEDIRVRLQKETGKETILIIYDVSPGGSSQYLADNLKKYSNILIFDHHGGAAPVAEVRGKEVTAAEVTVSSLLKLWESGALESKNGEELQIVAATHAMNVDPDAVITGFLIQSFTDPMLRKIGWNPQNLERLIKAARFGDTSLFGGVNIPDLSHETMTDEMKIAFTILHLINCQKEELVIQSKLDEVVLQLNLDAAARKWFENPEMKFDSFEQARAELIEAIKSKAGSGTDFNKLSKIRYQMLDHILGENIITPTDLEKLQPPELREITFSVLSRSQVREVFTGKPAGDFYSESHGSYWSDRYIDKTLEYIRDRIPNMLNEISLFEDCYWEFAKGLKNVHQHAGECSSIRSPLRAPHKSITVTTPNGRIDRKDGVPQSKQQFPTYDWLREASAAYGDPVLHVMNRDGQLTIAARFPQPGEKLPYVQLNHPEFIRHLLSLETRRATEKGKPPAKFLIKANLVLPLGPHNISLEDAIKLLTSYYNDIVMDQNPTDLLEPEFHLVDYGNGQKASFNGIHQFLVARGLS